MTSTPRRLTTVQAQSLTLSSEPWLSCEDCFTLADRYVETLLADPQTSVLPEMLTHLRACAACAEEAQSLIRLAAADLDSDPLPALDRLRP